MPQFDSTFFLSQLFWLSVCFLTVFLILWKKALPQLASIFKERSLKIQGQREDAEAIRSQGQKIIESTQARLSKTRFQAQSHINATLHEINHDLAQKRNEMTQKLKTEIKATEARISGQKKEAYKHVRTIAAHAAVTMGETLASIQVNPSQAFTALEKVLNSPEYKSHPHKDSLSNAP